MTDVFVSYSHIDSKIADEICQMLESESVTYFRDVKEIEWGDSIDLEVRSALEGSSAVIVIISPASLKSYWVSYEIGYATAFRKRILPYLTHPSLDVPSFINDLKYITSIEQAQEYFHTKFVEEKNSIYMPSELLRGVDYLSKLRKAYSLMPKLLQEMRNDVVSDKTRLVRELIILPSNGVMFNSSKHRFSYYENEHDDLINQIDLLEEYGFLIDVTPGNTPIYRMKEEFVDLLASTSFDDAYSKT